MNNVTTKVISLKHLKQRKAWDCQLVESLLGEPDFMNTAAEDIESDSFYNEERVLAAENHQEFLEKEKSNIEPHKETVKRAYGIKKIVLSAIQLDLDAVEVPTSGKLPEVFEACKKQMHSYANTLKEVDIGCCDAVFGTSSEGGWVVPDLALYGLIAARRPDLCFEAGRRYQVVKMKLYQWSQWGD